MSKRLNIDEIEIMKTEIWKDVEGYEGLYRISNLGNIYSIRNKRLLKPQLGKNGYYTIGFYVNSILKRKSIHRLMAIAFISNMQNKPNINHKNGIKSDNRLQNIEWCTQSENMKHAYRTIGITPSCSGKFGEDHPVSKPVNQLSKDGIFIKRWSSAQEINRQMPIDYRNISAVCLSKRNSAGGFKWEFAEC